MSIFTDVLPGIKNMINNMYSNSSARLFSTTIPLNVANTIFNLCLDDYRFYYLFTPSIQLLKKRGEKSGKDGKQGKPDFDYGPLDFSYACGRFFDEKGELAWISEDGSIYCSLCGAELPAAFESLCTWTASDFTLIHHKDHQLILWYRKKTGQWQDGNIPRSPEYGVGGKGRPILRVREWCSENKQEKYIQYVSIERINLEESRNYQTKRQVSENE